jgi:hypothetical protein
VWWVAAHTELRELCSAAVSVCYHFGGFFFYMTYTSSLDNCFGSKHGLNLSQLYLMSLIVNLHTWADKIVIGNEVFYKISKKKVISELPLLTDKEDTVYRLMKQLEEKELISVKKIDGIDHIATTRKCADWNRKSNSEINPSVGNKSEQSEINPKTLGNKSEQHSEINPTDNNTIYNQNTNNQDTKTGVEENLEPPKPPLVNSPLGLMTRIWKHHFPNYVFVPKNDNPALREISEIIFKKQPSLVDEQTLKEGFSNFCKKVKSHNFYSNTSLGTVRNKIQDILMHDCNKAQIGTFKRSQLDSGVPQDAYASLAKTVNS